MSRSATLFPSTGVRSASILPALWRMTTAAVAALLYLAAPSTAQPRYDVVAAFDAPGSNPPQPAQVIQAADGNFYGTRPSEAFKVDAAGTLTILHRFMAAEGTSPNRLLQAADGNFYGTTASGGSVGAQPGYGTVFKMDAAGNVTTLHRFTGPDGASPMAPLIRARDGNFYGTTSAGGAAYVDATQIGNGTVFRIDAAGSFATVHSFTGICTNSPSMCATTGLHPQTALIQASDGLLYGTTSGVNTLFGTVFRMDAAGAVTTLTIFAADVPIGALIQASDGNFYGMIRGHDFNALFMVTSTGALSYLHSFPVIAPPPVLTVQPVPLGDLLQGADGGLYGLTTLTSTTTASRGSVFKMDLAGNFTTLQTFTGPNGASPADGLFQGVDGRLYGTTARGGPAFSTTNQGYGTIFTIDLNGTLTTVHAFQLTVSGGASPADGVVEASDGTLYGATSAGGFGRGTVFSIAAGSLTTLYRFPWDDLQGDGSNPIGGLLRASDGRLYGTTQIFGASGRGTVFAIDAAGDLTNVHQFTALEGGPPSAGLIQASDGNFYGSTSTSIFRMNAAGLVTILHTFTTPTGLAASPQPLTQAPSGSFYGTTLSDGQMGYGTVFSMDPANTVTTLHTFNGPDGANPVGRLLRTSDGSFYGVTLYGGASYVDLNTRGYGTIFKIDSSGTFTTVHSFTGDDGLSPSSLTQASDGTIYGTTVQGGLGYGTLFAINAAGTPATLHQFNGIDGANPSGALIQGHDGAIYGTTQAGGPNNAGLVFRVVPPQVLPTAWPVPGNIEAEDYDTGGQGIGYFDNTPGNEGGAYRADDVDIKPSSEGGYAVGWFTAGEWLAYTINVQSDGVYTISARVGSALPGRTFHIEVDGTDVTGPLAVPLVDDWDRYGVVSRAAVRLHAGTQRMRVVMGPDDWMDLQRISITRQATATAVPGTIEAEDYDTGGPGIGYVDLTPGNEGGVYRTDDVDIEASHEGGYAIGWFQAGEWLAYTINVQSAGTYTISAHVGSALPGRTFHVEIDGVDVTGPIAVPLVGDWDHYGDVARAGVSLHAGTQVLRVVMGPDDWMDLQRIAITRQAISAVLPGKIEAEDYDPGGPGVGYVDLTPGNDGSAYRTDDVDIKPSSEGGYAVGWFMAGEWLAYTVDVQRGALYTFTARVGSLLPGRTFHLEADGVDVTGPIAVPLVGDWDQYGTVSVAGVALHAGVQRLRVVMGPDDWMDLQWIAFAVPPS